MLPGVAQEDEGGGHVAAAQGTDQPRPGLPFVALLQRCRQVPSRVHDLRREPCQHTNVNT